MISTHTPARGVTINISINVNIKWNFNPHSRKGSDHTYLLLNFDVTISTHTPARGVTHLGAALFAISVISTHTPARGVTRGGAC